MICGRLWSFAVVCAGLGWFAMVCGGLSYSHTANEYLLFYEVVTVPIGRN